ncbi:helix-turn-helix domain-containing protein [Chitinophaga lutea]
MPKAAISQLVCAERFEDGKIAVRTIGQFDTGIHFHAQAQLSTPEKGMIYLYSEYGNYCVPANHYVYVAPNIPHNLISRSQNLTLKSIFLDLPDEPEHSAVRIFSPSTLLDHFLDFGIRHWNGGQDAELKAACIAALKKMLPHALTNPVRLHTNAPKSERLLKAIEFISGALGENLTVAAIAKEAAMPERTLFRLFKEETGMTLFQFIKLSRMQKAIELMDDSSLTISEIVYAVGYESVATFSNVFKQLLGIGPQKYRQQVADRK